MQLAVVSAPKSNSLMAVNSKYYGSWKKNRRKYNLFNFWENLCWPLLSHHDGVVGSISRGSVLW